MSASSVQRAVNWTNIRCGSGAAIRMSHSMRRVEFQSPQLAFRRIRLKTCCCAWPTSGIGSNASDQTRATHFNERTRVCTSLSIIELYPPDK